MTVRAYVTFEDPLTPIVGADDDEAPPPGRALANELARGLQAGGLALSRPVSQWEGYGWEFTVNSDGRDVWFMLQPSDEWLLISNAPRRLLEKVRNVRVESHHENALRVLASVLAHTRFTKVRWFTKDEFENRQAGADAP